MPRWIQEEPDDEPSAGPEKDEEMPWAEAPADDFPPEEEDEDNPDWYRYRDLGDDAEERGAAAERSIDTSESDDWGVDDPDDEPLPTTKSPPKVPSGLALHVDAEGYYVYVLAKRSPQPLESEGAEYVQNALQHAGLQVVKAGRSFRPGANGVQYDWYFRVLNHDGTKPSESVARRALPSIAKTQDAPRESHDIAGLRRALAAANEAITRHTQFAVDLRKELDQARQAERRALGALEKVRLDFSRAIDSHRESEDALVGKLATLLKSRERQQTGETPALIAHLETELVKQAEEVKELRVRDAQQKAELDQYVRSFDSENASLKSDNASLKYQRDAALQEVDALRARAEQTPADSGMPRSKGGLGAVLRALLPSVHLHGGSLDVMHKELQDPMPVLGLIGNIAAGDVPPKKKAVTGAPGWQRVRYLTGTSWDGRLYFARRRTGSRLEVLVSRKGQQHTDVAYLRTIPLG
jgi:hypothetical protein